MAIFRFAFLCSAVLLASCATQESETADEGTFSVGHVIGVEVSNSYKVVGHTEVPYRGKSLDVARPELVTMRFYTIRASSGEIIRTKSPIQANEGDCVVLQHAPREAIADGSEYNYVGGIL